MATKYNRRAIMKAAWTMKKDRRRGWMFTFAECLKYAWAEAKKAAARYQDAMDRKYSRGEYSAAKVAERRAQVKTSTVVFDNAAQKGLYDYYANNRYNGD